MNAGDLIILLLVAAAMAAAVAFICKNGGFAGSCGGDCAHCASACKKAEQARPAKQHSTEKKMITVSQFEEKYTQDVIRLVLHFQNDGTRPPVSVDDQPDLLSITGEYIDKGGNFWIAKDGDTLIGSIGLMPCTAEIAILKKFFVDENYQGKPYHIGRALYNELLTFAREKAYKTILLDTPRNTTRAHMFYEKAGFRKISEEALPIQYSHPYQDCDFFLLEL